jgi:hypothetical protein
MISIFLIVILILLIYFGFCVQGNEYTILGRFKLSTIDLLYKFSTYIPENTRNRILALINYCLYQRNPIIQVRLLITP